MILTVDTGGTKTLLACFDKNGEPEREHRFETPKDSEEYIQTLVGSIKNHFADITLTAISIAIPGVVKDGVVLWCGNLPWKNVELRSKLAKQFDCPIYLENDANLAALSEANQLEPVPSLALYITVSTGIGGGLIRDGKLLPALSVFEPGHMKLEFDGARREWEDFASAKAVYETFGKHGYDIESKDTWDQIALRVHIGLLALIPAFQPEVVVVGGSLGTHFEHYSKTLRDLLDDHLPPHTIRPKLKQAKHPQEAVIYGCYYYAVHRLGT